MRGIEVLALAAGGAAGALATRWWQRRRLARGRGRDARRVHANRRSG